MEPLIKSLLAALACAGAAGSALYAQQVDRLPEDVRLVTIVVFAAVALFLYNDVAAAYPQHRALARAGCALGFLAVGACWLAGLWGWL